MSATASSEPASSGPVGSGAGRARRTLRGRVSLLGLLVIAAWAVVLTVGFDVAMHARLNRQRDAVLRDRAATVAATVFVSARGVVTVHDRSGDEALDSGIWVYAGRHAIERPGGGAALQAVADSLVARGPVFGSSHKYRLYSEPLMLGHRQVGTVVASSSNTPYERAFAETVEGSAVVAALMLGGAYPVFRFAAARALAPVDAMTRQAAHWSAHGLNERFGPDQRFREVQSLASTLDAVLDRLAAVVRHERRLPAELSHELRTPLSRIVAETDLLLARPHTAAESTAAHHAIRDSAQSMNRILETLLDAARLDAHDAPGRCELRAVVTDLARAGQETPAGPPGATPGTSIGGSADAAGAPAGASIDVRVSAELSVGADAAIIERVLAPILDNARRYARTTISVTARRTSDSVLIDISDDGPGVPAEYREAVFEPGRRLSPGDEHRGAGLGLPLSRRLARSVAGDVTVVGPGSRFRVRMPPG